jgi:hypothetical protein
VAGNAGGFLAVEDLKATAASEPERSKKPKKYKGADIGPLIDEELDAASSSLELSAPSQISAEGDSFKVVLFAVEVIGGPDAGKRFTLDKSSSALGRGKADLSFQDTDISRLHALIEVNRVGQVTIRDMGSTNGTFVNGKKVVEARLNPQDQFQIGGTLCRLVQLG